MSRSKSSYAKGARGRSEDYPKTIKVRSLEELPEQEPMRGRGRWITNGVWCNHRYVQGLLRRSIGRPWGLVYSHLCAVMAKYGIKSRAAVDDALWNLVTSPTAAQPRYQYTRYYVDGHGILRLHVDQPKKHQRPKVEEIEINDKQWYEKINGFWYRITGLHRGSAAWLEAFDKPFYCLWSKPSIIHEKRQLSAKELKKLGVHNDNQEK